MSRVICAFPGLDRSAMVEELQGIGINIISLDSKDYPEEDFPANYMAAINDALLTKELVVVSTHASVRAALADIGSYYALAYPSNTNQKEEYLQRYRDAGASEEFVTYMDTNWDTLYNDVANDTKGEHFPVSSGDYLISIMISITW